LLLAAGAGGAYWLSQIPAKNTAPPRPMVPGAATPEDAQRLARLRVLASVHFTNSKLEDPRARAEIERAVDEAEEAAKLAPDSALDQLNYAIALLRYFDERKLRVDPNQAGDWTEKAKPILQRAIDLIGAVRATRPTLAPAQLHAAMAQVRRGKLEAADPQSDWEGKAREAAEAYWKIEDRSAALRYHIGALDLRAESYEKAEAHLRRAIELDPDHPNAYYALAQALIRQGKPKADYEPLMTRHKMLQEEIGKARAQWDPDAVFEFNYPELIPIESPALAATVPEAVHFEELSGPPASVVVPLLRGDAANAPGALAAGAAAGTQARAALWAAGESTPGSVLLSITQKGAEPSETPPQAETGALAPIGATAADFDGDHISDLLVGTVGAGIRWLRGLGLTPSDGYAATAVAGLPEQGRFQSLGAADLDADGDLDLLAVGEKLSVYRADPTPVPAPEDTPPENATFSPRFTEITEASGIEAKALEAQAFAFLDYDGRNDTDVVIAGRKGSALFANRRMFRFERIAELPAAMAVAGADLDADGRTDVLLANADGLWLAASNGAGLEPPRRIAAGPLAAPRILAVDLENRGALDVLLFDTHRVSVLRTADGKSFVDVASRLIPTGFRGIPRAVAVQDLDEDYDLDVVVARTSEDGKPMPAAVFANRGAEKYAAAALTFRGTKTNRSGLGTRVEVRTAGTRRMLEAWQLPVYIGGGPRRKLDGVFLKWTNGIDEAQGDVATGRFHYSIERRGREGSCPFLYSWNGKRFEFVTDAIGATPLGLLAMPGLYVPPQEREWLRIRSDQLVPKDGRYELRFTEEMRESTYLDRVSLLCIDHPAGTSVYPDERFCFPPFPEKRLLSVRQEIPVRAAWDAAGRDVTAAVASEDRRYASPAERIAYQGMSTLHALTLDLGDLASARKVQLFLTGWFAWTNSSINQAIFHAGIRFTPPRVDVLAAESRFPSDASNGLEGTAPWRTVVPDAGFPAGMQKTMCIDLTGKLKAGEHIVRLVTNLQLHWDRVFVALDDTPIELRTTELAPAIAELRTRGVSRWRAPLEGAPSEPVYEEATTELVYDLHVGEYTRLGDVRELLTQADDRFVIFPHGDEVALSFDASAAPQLPDGWTRTFILDSHGWAKDADPTTFAPTTVEPLPFRGMSGYPYRADEHYPDTPETRRYRSEWNTRKITSPRPIPIASGIEAIHEK